jgi:histidyl-tRNA synthetase
LKSGYVKTASMSQRYKVLRGMHDILPEEVGRWQFLEATTRAWFARYGFREIRTPILEPTELFTRSVGESSDIVGKEMYTIAREDESITLRPENTASVVRAFVQHSRHREVAQGYPERLYYIGPMFRHESPQLHRQRQFHQIGVEVLGGEEALIEAETIEMVWSLLRHFEIENVELRLGSVGDEACRPAYRQALQDWLGPRLPQMCEDCNRRFASNPLRVFDCKVASDRQLLADAPRMNESLCDPCQAHYTAVKGHLDELGVAYVEDANLVRGLDYYRRTVFEIVGGGLGAQNAVLGGGRYDGLVQALGGRDVPGFGFAMGMERAIAMFPEGRVPATPIDVSLVALGPDGHAAAPGFCRLLRNTGISVQMSTVERPMNAQLKRANKVNARFAVFIGKDEIAQGLFGLKDLTSGQQQQLDEAGLIGRVKGSNDGNA